MPYVRNLTSDHVRIGRQDRVTGELHGVQLEPRGELCVPEIGAEDQEGKPRKLYRASKDIAEVSDEIFAGFQFRQSLGVLIEELTEEEFNERAEFLRTQHTPGGRSARKLEVFHIDEKTGEKKTLPVVLMEPPKPVAVFPIKGDETVDVTGATQTASGRPDPARGGKTLTQLRQEEADAATRGVRRVEEAGPGHVDPSVLAQMGKGV